MKIYGRAILCAACVLHMMGCAAKHNPGPSAVTHQPDPAAIQEVHSGKRTMASAAWWGFDAEDSTRFLQAAIRSGAKTLVIPNMGKPWIVTPLFLESNQEIVFEEGVVLMAKEGAFRGKGDSLLTARGKDNVTLRGTDASIVMRKHDYQNPPYEKAEWRNTLSILGCRNVKVDGLRFASSGGDGIYLGRGAGDHTHNQNITIKNVVFEDHHRQGISVITAENLLVEGCTLRGTQGTDPQAGIDFEPNAADEHLMNCVVRDCIIDHNAGYGVQLYLGTLRAESEPISVTVSQCQIHDNHDGAIAVMRGGKPAADLRGEVRLVGNKISGKQTLDRGPNLRIQVEE